MCCYLIIIRFLSELANAKTGAGRAVGLVAFATLRLLGLRFYFHLTPGSAADAAVPGANNLSPRYHGALKFGSLRSQHHIKLPDKLQFIGLPHLQTVNAWASLAT